MRRTYTTPCVDCGTELTLTYPAPKGGISCGNGPCLTAHNARAAEVSRRRGEAQHARRRRTPMPLYGDLRWVAALNGITTDGTGRKTR